MKNEMRQWLLVVCAFLCYCFPAIAAVVTSATVPATRSSGTTITAPIWNNDVQGVYGYINNNVVAAINTLTTKGDMFAYDGSSLQKFPIGAEAAFLTADSSTSTGLAWKPFVAASTLTTKGDVLTFSTVVARLGVGANNTVLVADSTQATGLKWDTPSAGLSTGMIVAWSPAAAGTDTIPSGWLLCDGTAGTPNLIGKFVIGTRTTTSSSTANTDGYGYHAPDAVGSTTTAHTHTATCSGSTGASSSVDQLVASTGANSYSLSAHTHSFSSAGTLNSTSVEPSDYALVYIMKS